MKNASLASAQIRAARALLRWSAVDLARQSRLGVNTIRRAEVADSGTSLTAANELAIRSALEFAGVDIHRRKRRRPGGPAAEAATQKGLVDLAMSQGGNSACILLPKGPYCGRSTCCNGRLVYDMGLNIKNDETYRLVDELAKLTGETMTAAVTEAVRERLDRIRRVRDGRLADRLLTIRERLCCAPKGAVQIGRSWRVAVRRPRVAR